MHLETSRDISQSGETKIETLDSSSEAAQRACLSTVTFEALHN